MGIERHPTFRRMVLSFMASECWGKSNLQFTGGWLRNYFAVWGIAIDFPWECGFRVRHPRLG